MNTNTVARKRSYKSPRRVPRRITLASTAAKARAKKPAEAKLIDICLKLEKESDQPTPMGFLDRLKQSGEGERSRPMKSGGRKPSR